ncbi:ATP-dependent zinc protease [Vibrio plantisponsor]|uniref:ATP-dependent zinc protease n=1 Tax=Vibrio plantisponsor TaxID=664643 RepID=A0ABU4IFJ9_9VIBR|nr:ATP-dependent zinc protease [Vibrio plantisponsor]MDW6017328.1 ATP-dependent zinc protease [Vibrio plantisponsor]NNM40270.1 ATP-dependent zinc protease [Vibrio plantisponsor]PNH87745.1 ATP-dependent Zn protease [Vibrio diazotrophicus]
MFKRIAPIVALGFLSGCTLMNGDEYHQATLTAIQQSNAQITNEITNLQLQLSNQNDYIDSLESKVLTLADDVKGLKVIAEKRVPKSVNKKSPTSKQLLVSKPQPQHKLVLGEIEHVEIKALDQIFDARVDTGAATSSLNAIDISEFERNGKQWVRFHLSDGENKPDDSNWIESPIVRYVRIRQSTNEETERRAVVQLWVKIGSINEKTEFTLADRSQMSHPILLGREFIRDIAVVDVSRKYIHTETN